eukprot:g8909.t1
MRAILVASLAGTVLSTACSFSHNGSEIGRVATRTGHRRFPRRAARFSNASASSGDSTERVGSSARGRSKNPARVIVRQAKEQDYPGVAGIREVIIPVGMSGATGFMGGKVVIDSPAEAEKRLLMAKVADLVSAEAVALIAIENGRIVGTVDCITQPTNAAAAAAAASAANMQRRPQKQSDSLGGSGTRATKQQPSQVFLKNLFVLPEERRRGIARQLVKGAEAFARKENAAAICLDVGRKNAVARELYLSCGFEEAERPGPVEGGMGGALLKSLGMGKRYMVKNF